MTEEKTGRQDSGKIDFVITWVDGNDPAWQAEKRKYSGESEQSDAREFRYRDFDLLRYWFRGVEKHAPWVNRVFFVTCGHLPPWINTACPKLRIVKHEEYIPARYLPTFSSRTVGLNLHRIEEMSEQFVYFNDDMFLIRDTDPEYFFRKGKPCANVGLTVYTFGLPKKKENVDQISQMYLTLPICMAVINRNFRKKDVLKRNWKYMLSPKNGMKSIVNSVLFSSFEKLPGFANEHLPYSFEKQTFREIWDREGEILERACSHRFREATDVSDRLMTFWQIAEGRKYTVTNDQIEPVLEEIKNRKHQILCINDAYGGNQFEKIKQQIIDAFEEILPEKSGFEL